MITAEILASLLVNFVLPISGQTHEFIIYIVYNKGKWDNLIICYHKKRNYCWFPMCLSYY